jgi:NAD kinase
MDGDDGALWQALSRTKANPMYSISVSLGLNFFTQTVNFSKEFGKMLHEILVFLSLKPKP